MALKGYKRAHESKTIVHAVATLVLVVLQMMGISEIDEGLVIESLMAIAVLYTSVRTILGRIDATKKIIK